MKNRLLALSLILCVASLAFVGNVQAQTITPGVSPGMVFDYHVSSYWTSNDPYSSIPQELIDVNKTVHVEVRIRTVNETIIETFAPYYFSNGSAVPDVGYINLFTGDGYGFVAIVGANLNVGDKIHPDGSDGLTVLDVTTRSYESGPRETIHVRLTDNNESYTAYRDWYFDKATGVLVEQVDRTDTNDPASTYQITWKLDSTLNVESWAVPEFPVLTAVPILLIAAAFATILYKKKMVKAPGQN